MKSNFDVCADDYIRPVEGGYVNNPKDPGGETNMGISKRSYPGLVIRTLTWANCKAIYKMDFWDKVSGDTLPLGVDLVTFDTAVNSGPSRALKFLTSANAGGGTPVDVIHAYSNARLGFLHGLRTWSTFGRGWSRRVADIEAAAVRMAGASAGHLVLLSQEALVKTQNLKHAAIVTPIATLVATSAVPVTPVEHGSLLIAGLIALVHLIGAQFHQVNLSNAYAKEASK